MGPGRRHPGEARFELDAAPHDDHMDHVERIADLPTQPAYINAEPTPSEPGPASRRRAGDQAGDPFPPEWLEIPPVFRRAKLGSSNIP